MDIHLAGSSTAAAPAKAISDAADAAAIETSGLAGVVARLLGFNGVTYDRLRSAGDNTDALAAVALGIQRVLSAGLVFNGATYDRLRAANVFKPFATTAITAGTGATIWTPAAGKKFRLMGWSISSSVAGQLIFGDNAVGTVIARTPVVAAAGIATIELAGNGILSAAINNVLKLDGPTGNVAGMVWGTEE